MTTAAPTSSPLPPSQVVARLLDVLQQRGITLCVLRNYETLPDPDGHDIDALAPPPQREALLAALRSDLPDAGLRLVQLHTRKGLIQAAVMDGAMSAESLVYLDLFTSVGHWRGIEYLSAARILDDARPRGPFTIPRPAHEACLSLLYPLLNAGQVKPAYVDRCAVLAEEDGEALDQVLTEAFGAEVAQTIRQSLAERDRDALNRLRPRVRSALIRQAARQPIRLARNLASYSLDKAISIGSRDRLAVAFIGPDGVGKTTVMRGLAEAVRRSFPGGIAYQHWRPSMVRGMQNQVGPVTPAHPPPGAATFSPEAEKASAHQQVTSIARLLVSAALFTIGYLVRVVPARLRRKLVLLDRYAYGYVMWPGAVKYQGPRWLAWAVLRWIPRPDVTILLTAPPEMIHERKPELTVEQIEVQIQRGREIVRRLPRIVEVDASGDVRQTLERVMKVVLGELASRVERRHPGATDRVGRMNAAAAGGAS